MELFLTIWGAAVIGLMRFAWANHCTLRDRNRFRNWARMQPNRAELNAALDDVDYDDHLWALFWGRDPWCLYHRSTDGGTKPPLSPEPNPLRTT